jgi:tetratricopeptide (TPR) repeat protein
MAAEETRAVNDEAPAAAGPLSPVARQRLQKLFEHAKRNSEKNDFDYAHDLFAQCVAGDPASIVYLQALLDNLKRKYDNNKKGSKMAGFKTSSGRKNLKAALGKEDWTGAFKAGCEVLKYTPWDSPTLMAMAEACERLGIDECQLYYLKWALNADAKNLEVNKQAARTLSRMGQFDQAIACWHRIEEAKPGDAEAAQEISRLTVEKAVHHGGYSREVISGKNEKEARAASGSGARAGSRGEVQAATKEQPAPVSREQFLRNKIESTPSELANYLELAKLYEERHVFEKALETLEQAHAASGGGDLTVRERLEDVQMRHSRHQVAIAKKRAADDPSDEAKVLAEKLQSQANQRELEIFAARVDRDPKNAAWRRELGIRLKTARKFRHAIEMLQAAAKDKGTKPAALLEMGECFQYLEEYDQALSKYRDAIEASGDGATDTKKRALYRAGVLATGLGELDQAEGFLRELADLDGQYRDVATRLDKVARLRNKE